MWFNHPDSSLLGFGAHVSRGSQISKLAPAIARTDGRMDGPRLSDKVHIIPQQSPAGAFVVVHAEYAVLESRVYTDRSVCVSIGGCNALGSRPRDIPGLPTLPVRCLATPCGACACTNACRMPWCHGAL